MRLLTTTVSAPVEWMPASSLPSLTKNFRVFTESKDGVLNHTLCTALIRPDGSVEKIWRGNFWKPQEVLARLR
jgi:protein SCO1/2